MTAPAITVPLQFKRRTGQSCLLKRKQLRAFRKLQSKSTRSFGVIQPYESHVSVKGNAFLKRKYFIKATGNGCYHEPSNLQPLVAKSPYSKATGKPDRDLVIRLAGKDHDEYGNRLRTNAQYKAIAKAKEYYHNPNVLPFIEVARKAIKNRSCGSHKIGRHRSEGREGLCCTLEVLFLNMDIHSFRVGRPDDSDKKVFHYAINESLAAQVGLHPKRLQRNLELLEAANIIYMKRQYEKLDNGDYVGKASAIGFTHDFMKAFGMKFTFNRTSQQLTKRDKQNAQRDEKTPEQIKAEATDKLCQAASGIIVSKATVKKDVQDLYSFLDTDDSPPDPAH